MKEPYIKSKEVSGTKIRDVSKSRAIVGVLQEKKKNAGGGRPPKYSESRRPITVTLPERILRDLQSINHDRSRAIVKCVETIMANGDRSFKPVELIELTPGKALILVGPSSSLKQIEWLRLVEITPLRYLLIIPTGTAVEVLEVTIQDLLRKVEPNSSESVLLEELLDVISHHRRGRLISKAELLFVDIPASRKP
jgi:hypothetical protein